MKSSGTQRASPCALERIESPEELRHGTGGNAESSALSPLEQQEIVRLLAAHRTDPGAVISWDEVKTLLKA
jgi:hypothetical protein